VQVQTRTDPVGPTTGNTQKHSLTYSNNKFTRTPQVQPLTVSLYYLINSLNNKGNNKTTEQTNAQTATAVIIKK